MWTTVWGTAHGGEQRCGFRPGSAGLQCELQLGTAIADDEGYSRGLLSRLIRNSIWGFFRKQRRNSSQGLSAWAEGPKPLHSSPFIYSHQWGLLSSDDRRLWCFIASTAGWFGELTGRAAPARLDAKKKDVLTDTGRLSNQWWIAWPKEFVKTILCDLLHWPSIDSWLGDRKSFKMIPNLQKWLWSDGEYG